MDFARLLGLRFGPVTAEDLIDGKYLLVQRGKKNYYLVSVGE